MRKKGDRNGHLPVHLHYFWCSIWAGFCQTILRKLGRSPARSEGESSERAEQTGRENAVKCSNVRLVRTFEHFTEARPVSSARKYEWETIYEKLRTRSSERANSRLVLLIGSVSSSVWKPDVEPSVEDSSWIFCAQKKILQPEKKSVSSGTCVNPRGKVLGSERWRDH